MKAVKQSVILEGRTKLLSPPRLKFDEPEQLLWGPYLFTLVDVGWTVRGRTVDK